MRTEHPISRLQRRREREKVLNEALYRGNIIVFLHKQKSNLGIHITITDMPGCSAVWACSECSVCLITYAKYVVEIFEHLLKHGWCQRDEKYQINKDFFPRVNQGNLLQESPRTKPTETQMSRTASPALTRHKLKQTSAALLFTHYRTKIMCNTENLKIKRIVISKHHSRGKHWSLSSLQENKLQRNNWTV